MVMKGRLLFFFQILTFVSLFSQESKENASITADTAKARTLIQEVDSLTNIRDYIQAQEKLNETIGIYQRSIGKSNELSDAIYRIGLLSYLQGDYVKAIKEWEKALEMRLKVPNPDQKRILGTYQNLGVLYSALSQFDKAIQYKIKASEGIRTLYGDGHLQTAHSLNSLAVEYTNLGDYESSLAYHQKAIEIRRAQPDTLMSDIDVSYSNLSIVYYRQGFIDKSIRYLQIALDLILRRYGDASKQAADAYVNLGNLFKSKADFEKALGYYEKALRRYQVLFPNGHPTVATIYSGFAGIFNEAGEHEQAIVFQKKSIQYIMQKLGRADMVVAGEYHNLARSYQSLTDYKTAIEYYERSKDLFIKIVGDKHPNLATVVSGIGLCYRHMGDYENALAYMEESLTLRKLGFGEIDPEVATFYFQLGNIHEVMGNFEKAMKSYEKCLKSFGFREGGDLANVSDLYRLIPSLYTTSALHRSEFLRLGNPQDLEKADQYSSYTATVIEALTKDLGPNSRPNLVSLSSTNYKGWSLVNYLRYQQTNDPKYFDKSFAFAESSKAFALHKVFNESRAVKFAGIPTSVLEQEESLRLSITNLEKRRQEKLATKVPQGDSTFLRISEELFNLKADYERFKSTLEQDFPLYYRLKYDFTTAKLDYLQDSLLQEDQTLLEYSVSDSSILIFTIQQDDFSVTEVKGSFPLVQWVKDFQASLTGYYGTEKKKRSDALYGKTLNAYIDLASKLYQQLIAPVEAKLRKEVIIIPDGVLGYIPFGALLTGNPGKRSSFDSYPFFFKKHQLTYCYSATLLQQMIRKRHESPPTRSLLALAPFATQGYSKLDQGVDISIKQLPNGVDTIIVKETILRTDLLPLPSSGPEVSLASELWDGKYYLGKDATEELVFDLASQYRILHLSTHAVADERLGDFSYLAFVEKEDSLENEYLYVSELYNLKLNADLVVLSACETANGELKGGEGIISLARAFAYAGAKSMLTTLWVVDDAVAKDLTRDFYIHLKQGETKDRALYLAKQQHLKRSENSHKHPFFWANFIAVGDMSPLN